MATCVGLPTMDISTGQMTGPASRASDPAPPSRIGWGPSSGLSVPRGAVLLLLSSLLVLLVTVDLPTPGYNMAWGLFGHQMGLLRSLQLSSGREGALSSACILTILALAWALLRLARTTGAGFVLLLSLLLLLSGATFIPTLSGGGIDLALLVHAVRALALALVVISAGTILACLFPPPLARKADRLFHQAAASPWLLPALAVLTGLGILAVDLRVLDGIPHAMDEIGQIFQAKIFASGRLWAQPPPLPDLISHFGVITDGGRWRSMWPPGHALAMAPFVAAGALWLYPPVVSALTVVAVFALVSRTDGRTTALLATLLLLSSPWFWSMGASYMSHSTSALLLASFLVCLVRARAGGVAAAAGAGLFLGFAAATREADALLLSAPLGALWLMDLREPQKRRGWLGRSVAIALGLVPGLGFLLGTNLIVNGGLFVFGHDVMFKGPYRFGFGPRLPGLLVQPLISPVHTLSEGLSMVRDYLAALQLVLFGLGVPSLTLVALSASRRVRDRLGVAALAGLALFLGAYAAFPLPMVMFGPRYAYGGLSLFAWLGARGILAVHRRLEEFGHAFAVPAIIAFGLLVACGYSIPAALASFDPSFAGVDRRLERELRARGIRRAIVVIPSDPKGEWGNPFLYTAGFRLAEPDLEGIVPVQVRENTTVETALDAFPDRPAFVWLAVYEGGLRRFHFATSALVRIRRPGEAGFEPDREAAVRHALETFTGALADGAGSPELWNTLGTLARLDGESALARARFARAAKLAPHDPRAWINLAILEREEGRTEAARAAAGKARSLGAVLPSSLATLLDRKGGSAPVPGLRPLRKVPPL